MIVNCHLLLLGLYSLRKWVKKLWKILIFLKCSCQGHLWNTLYLWPQTKTDPFLVGTGPYEVHTWPSRRLSSMWFIHSLPLCIKCNPRGTRKPCLSPGMPNMQWRKGWHPTNLWDFGPQYTSLFATQETRKYKFVLFEIYLFHVYACFAYMHSYAPHVCLVFTLVRRGWWSAQNSSYRKFCAAMWVLRMKPAKEASALYFRVICPAPKSKFFVISSCSWIWNEKHSFWVSLWFEPQLCHSQAKWSWPCSEVSLTLSCIICKIRLPLVPARWCSS